MAEDLILDVRDLEPPEPLEKVLEALCSLRAGQRIRMIHWREPYPLYSILGRDGFAHETRTTETGDFEILIWRPENNGTLCA
ncbi:MAG: DUF2249 domain-containing protein [Betaproteobacteria bacterium]|nr:DUF2249 domain-containing protein [Betaproteobacteria bacterium]MDE2623251.1 DUF2249 domain-containing protein [Betaproteobacteria bacterium]